MDADLIRNYRKLIEKEKWEILENKGDDAHRFNTPFRVIAGGREFPLSHPFQIHLTLYRRAQEEETRFLHMKAVHDYLWPHYRRTWNDWEELRFRAHCGPYRYITLASGAGCGKSLDMGKIGYIWWLSNPRKHATVISSTTLESLESRIWGYAIKLHQEAVLPVPALYLRSKPPKIIHPEALDKIHGMFAIAIREGEGKRVISNLIGRHPDVGIMMILDEATELPVEIVDSLPNLEKSVDFFQLWALGNSASKHDLHGALSTPRRGWENVTPDMPAWETTREKGICLYFNPYKSPAIYEQDPGKRALLSRFLPTETGIQKDKMDYGADSDNFWRMGMGFWKAKEIENVIISEPFLHEHQVANRAEWSGFYPLAAVAGLDPAFTAGGDNCVLRRAIIGQAADGSIVLDFQGTRLTSRIDIKGREAKSGELQIAEETIAILRNEQIPISNLAIDCSGSGRAIGELIKIVSKDLIGPIKLISTGGVKNAITGDKDPTFFTMNITDMWLELRKFIPYGQIRGLDPKTIFQMSNRVLKRDGKRVALESKRDYKIRMAAMNPTMAHSPDDADAAILALWAAIIRHSFRPNQKREMPADYMRHDWFQKLYAFQEEKKLTEMAAVGTRARPKLAPNYAAGLEDVSPLRLRRE